MALLVHYPMADEVNNSGVTTMESKKQKVSWPFRSYKCTKKPLLSSCFRIYFSMIAIQFSKYVR